MSADDRLMRQILRECRRIAVVGLSPKPERDSYQVARFMQAHGYQIIPINPNASEILGQPCYPSLSVAAQHGPIDLVNCFRNAVDIPPIAEEAVAIRAKALWLQLGIRQDQACAQAAVAGLWTVQDRCLKADFARLQASLSG